MIQVDNGRWPMGRMLMCHLIADSHEELETAADALGLRRSYIQHAHTWKEHLDVSQSKRTLAVQQGAREITQREFARILTGRREREKAAREALDGMQKDENG